MYLNLYQIMENIPYPFQVYYCRDKSAFALQKIQIYSYALKGYDAETLYFVQESELHDLDPNDIHLLILGQIPENFPYDKALSVSCILVDSADFIMAYNILQDIFTAFQTWETTILNSIIEYTSLQNILDQCAKMLNNPIALFDNQQNLLLKSGIIPDTSKRNDLWDFVLKHGYSPKEQTNEINKKMVEEKLPFYYNSKNKYKKIQRLIAVLHRNHAIFGNLALSDVSAPFTQGEYSTVCLIQKYMNQAIIHTKEFHFNSQNTPWFIIQLLRNQHIDSEVLDYNIRRYNHTSTDPYFLWTFQKDSDKNTSISSLMPNICYALKTDLVFYYAKQLIVIDHQLDHFENASFKEQLHNYMVQNHLRCGCSMIFHNIMQLHTAFMQSQISVSEESADFCSDFLTTYRTYLLKVIRNQNESDGLIYPGLDILLKKDSIYGRELLLCLQKYILSGQNLSATSKTLFIHRHTVLYRIQKIEDLLDKEIASMAENELNLLYLSCCRLLGE